MIYTNKFNFGEQPIRWNPWFGCFRVSEGCANCFIQSLNSFTNRYFEFNRNNHTYTPGRFVLVCINSDFFIEQADCYREQAWSNIRNHPDLIFLIITKRVDRIVRCLPIDWGDGYDNVIICATTENQSRVDERLPILLDIPLKHRWVTCSPLLGEVDLSKYLSTGKIEHVEAFGEKLFRSSSSARPVQYNWFKKLSDQCKEYNVRFSMPYVGNQCIMPDGTSIGDCCTCYHSELADSLQLFNYKPITFHLQNLDVTY